MHVFIPTYYATPWNDISGAPVEGKVFVSDERARDWVTQQVWWHLIVDECWRYKPQPCPDPIWDPPQGPGEPTWLLRIPGYILGAVRQTELVE